MDKLVYIPLLVLVFFLGVSSLSLGTVSLVIELNPINTTNITTIDKCENNTKQFLRIWGISAIVVGSLVLIWGSIQTVLFVMKIISSPALAWMNNVPAAFILGILYMFPLFFIGINLFGDPCLNHVRYYYWSIGCAIFSISIIFVGISFLTCIGFMCAGWMDADDD